MSTPTRTPEGVWMHDADRTESVSRMVAIDAMVALGMDPLDWRVRDKIISGIATRINSTIDNATSPLQRELFAARCLLRDLGQIEAHDSAMEAQSR